MRIALVLAAFLVCLSAGSAFAGQAETRCTVAAAIPAAIDTIQKDFANWDGRCVRVRGLAFHDHLYVDRLAILKTPGRYTAASEGAIAVYPKEDRGNLPPEAAWVEVVGKLGSCTDEEAATQALRKQEPDQLIMTFGYCHTSLENYIAPVAVVIASHAPILRLTEKEVPPDRRPLADAAPDVPDRAAQLAAARAAIAALKAGDEAAFLRLSDPETAEDVAALKGRSPEKYLQEDIEKAHSLFQDQAENHGPFASVSSTAQERVFINQASFKVKTTDPQEPPPLIICWCKTADCGSKWPIMSSDADNAPERPYACARTGETEIYPNREHVIEVETTSRTKGLAEPDWSKYPAAH